MVSLNFSEGKKILAILALILVVFIPVAIFLISYADKKVSKNSSTNSELNALLVKVDEAISPGDKSNIQYKKAQQLFQLVKTSKTPKEKYDNFKAATSKLQFIYSTTHHGYLYSLLNTDLASYAKKNFPKDYEDFVFNYPCQDPSCTKSAQPAEILSIVEDIKTSDLPKEYKDNYIQNLLNTGYETEAGKDSQVWQYLATAQSLEVSSDLSKSGSNLTIANKIRGFLKTNYPQDYELLEKAEVQGNAEAAKQEKKTN